MSDDRYILQGKSFVDTKTNQCLNFGIKDLSRVLVQLNNMEMWLNQDKETIADIEAKLAESDEYRELLLEEKAGYLDLISGYADKCKELEQQLEETEELNKKLAEHSQSVDKALDDSCDVIRNLKMQLAEKEKEETKRMEEFEKGCQQYYKSNQTAIAVLKKVKKLFEEKYTYDVEESDFAVIYETDIDEIIDQQIKSLKGE